MSKKYRDAYIDWDGVLWDFKRAYCDWMGYEVPDTDKWEFYKKLGVSTPVFQNFLKRVPQDFWEQKKYILPHAQDLVAWARRNAENVFVLTVAPEWECSQGKQNLARAMFNLGVYTVANAEEKVEFAKRGCVLIDDKPDTVEAFDLEVIEFEIGGGFIWPTNYNQGLADAWYFKKSWLHEPKAEATNAQRWDALYPSESAYAIGAKDAAALSSIGASIEDVKAAFTKAGHSLAEKGNRVKADLDRVTGTIHDVNLYDYSGKIEGIEMKPTNPKDIAGSKKAPVNSMMSGAVKAEIGVALLEGALKYGRHNYRQDGVRASVYYDAVGRHLDAYWEGEDIDPESNLHHVTKAIAGLIVLRDCQIRGMCNDDRPPKTLGFLEELNEITKKLIKKYPEPVDPVTEILLREEKPDA